MASRQGPDARQAGQGRPARGRLHRALPRVARPRGRARRPERAPPGHASTPDPRRGLDDRRQGVAPEGHRPRPRRRAQRPAPPRRRRRLRARSRAATPSRSTARRAARRCARRSRVHADRDSIAVLDGSDASTSPSTKTAAEAPGEVGRERCRRSSSSPATRRPRPKSFRNIPRVSVVTAPARVGVADDHRPPLDRRLRGRPRGARGPRRRGRHARQRRRAEGSES